MPTNSSTPAAGQICMTCCYWRPDGGIEQGKGWGQCRRMPPATPPIDDEKLVHVGVWPSTQESDWCGEWRAVVPPE